MLPKTLLLIGFGILLSACQEQASQTQLIYSQMEASETQQENGVQNINPDTSLLKTGWYFVAEAGFGAKRTLDKSYETFFIDRKPILEAKNIVRLNVYEQVTAGEKLRGLTMQMDAEGAEKWSSATEKAMGKELAFVAGNRLIQVLRVNAQITSGMAALNRSDYSKEDFIQVKKAIEAAR